MVVLWEVATKHTCLKLSTCLTCGRRGGMRPFPGGNVRNQLSAHFTPQVPLHLLSGEILTENLVTECLHSQMNQSIQTLHMQYFENKQITLPFHAELPASAVSHGRGSWKHWRGLGSDSRLPGSHFSFYPKFQHLHILKTKQLPETLNFLVLKLSDPPVQDFY